MQAWSVTDAGVSRSMNQDYFHMELFREQEYALCAVCDGMGGARAGNIASKLACAVFIEELQLIAKPAMNAKAMRTALRQAARTANQKVYDKSRSSLDYHGMGTTLVGGVVTPDRAVFVNIGDSRAYLVAEDGLQRITRDHSVVEDMLERGDISPEEARIHPNRNLITRALGTEPDVQCDLFTLELRTDDILLLCSDGLTNVMEDQEIMYEILHGGELSGCCQRLVDIVNRRGGPDNITAVLMAI